jgi:hypothetical protein
MLLTAVAFNLKKLLNYHPKKTVPLAIALPRLILEEPFLTCWKRRHHWQVTVSERWARSSAISTTPSHYGR